MKRLLAPALFVAALLGATAQAQIITNYGQDTYGPLAPGGPYGIWDGAWDGQEGLTASGNRNYMAQTFQVPAGYGELYSYNIQLQLNNATVIPTFTTAIYEWNTTTNTTVGSAVTSSQPFQVTSNDFSPYGYNFASPSGITLNPTKTYAIVVARVGTTTGNQPVLGTDSNDSSNSYLLGQAFRSTNGSTWNVTGLSGTDVAFWVSFSANSLSPVPEPAVNGAIIGAGLVATLAYVRRRRANAAATASA